MDHSVNLTELQQVVGKYVDQYQLLVAAGPVTAAGLTRMVLGPNKVISGAVKASTAWFAVKELSGPVLNLLNDQFGYLQNIFGMFGS